MKPWSPRGPHTPPRRAKSDTMPPMAGPMASVDSRWPSRMPRMLKGTSPTRISAVIASHFAADRCTPRVSPAA